MFKYIPKKQVELNYAKETNEFLNILLEGDAMMGHKEIANELRKKIDAQNIAVKKLIRIDELTPEEIEGIIALYDKWEDRIGTIIKKDELVRYEGELYKSLAEHTADANFNPIITNYHYVLATPKETIDYWKAPTGYQNDYSKGDLVIYKPDGKTYVSKIDGNSQEPTKDEPHNRYWELKEA